MLFNMEMHQRHCDALKTAINTLHPVNYDSVSEFIPQLLEKEQLVLDAAIYPPADATVLKSSGIGRYLLYDHSDKNNPVSIWLFAFASGQKTSIHDHRYRATVTVIRGPISEKYYLPSGETRATLVAHSDRCRFHTNRDDLNDPFVHQLKRRKDAGGGVSLTLHIYEMQAHRLSMAGEKRDNRNLNRIYSKAIPPESNPSSGGREAQAELDNAVAS